MYNWSLLSVSGINFLAPSSVRQPHSSPSVSVLPVHAPTTSSHYANSPLWPSITPSLFHFRPTSFTNLSHHKLLLYGVEMYGNTTKYHINKLVILNNNILRIAQNKQLRYRLTDLYKNYNTLPRPELHKFQLFLVYKYYYRNDQLPPAFTNICSVNKDVHHYQTRCSDLLHLSRINTSHGTKCKLIKFKASQMWNVLPTRLRKISKINTFRNHLTTYFQNTIALWVYDYMIVALFVILQ